MQKDKNRIWRLLGKKLSGEASEEELHELAELLRNNPEFGFYAEFMSDLKKVPPPENKELDESFKRVAERLIMRENKNEAPLRPKTAPVDRPRTNWPRPHRLWHFFSNGTFANYLKLTWRNLARHKAFSVINIGGLSIGMASAVLVLLWIYNEWSFDRFHKKADRIFLVLNRGHFNDEINVWGATPMVMGPVLKAEHPEIEEVVRSNWVAAFILKNGDKQVQTHGYLTDPGFLKVFDFPLERGDPMTALAHEHSIVITRKLARQLFGEENVMGKTIRIDSNALFTVTGIVKDLPNNTQFDFDYLVPWSYMKEVGWDNPNWGEFSIVQTYVLLKPGINELAENKRIANIYKAHSDVPYEIFLHPIRKWRLWSRFENGKITGGDIDDIKKLGLIAAFILLVACINYMNLSTARSVKRAREVGIRKVSGAQKATLVWQFLGESILIALFAGIIAMLLVQRALPWFNGIVYKSLYVPYGNIYFWLLALGFILFIGVLAGSFPAFHLSSFRPIRVLRGSFPGIRSLVTPRKVLVVLQFSFAIILIISTIVVYNQVAFARKRDSGYNMQDLAFVYVKGDVRKNYPIIRDELLRSGAVTDITRTNCPATDIWEMEDSYEWPGKDPTAKTFFVRYYTDQDFVKTLQLKMIAGRPIDISAYPTDSTAIMLNESAAKLMAFANPVGQEIKSKLGSWHIVGVVKDFIPGTPYQPLLPMVIQGPGIKDWFGTITFKLSTARSTRASLALVSGIFKKYNPDYPTEVFFVDKSYAARFEDVLHTGTLFALFAGLTIFISCLGLFGLATYMAENRIREIGIRKVLGASVTTITSLLSKDFLKLVIISFVIASPIAWWVMHKWLQQYPYRVSIEWWVFAVTGLLSLFVAALTVVYQAIKAALANPVMSLRNE